MLSLYRRHRPRSFDQVVGQAHIVRTLRNAIELGKVHHAYLFVGSRGTGKTSMAKLLACALNSEGGANADFSPDDPAVRSIMAGNSIDVVEMDAASNNSVDDIRDLRENVALAPMGGGMRVYILDEAHMLSTSAWNAFLKTLEEPPQHVVFVLATTEAHKVPATIVDRCHRFDFQRPSLEQIASVLRRVAAEESIEVPDAAIAMIARAATGSFRDALGTLEQLVTYGGNRVQLDDVLEVLGVADAELVLEAAESLVAHDPRAALLAVERLSASGRDLTQFMRDLAAHLRHLFVVQTLGDVPDSFAVTAQQTDRLSAQAEQLAQGEILRAIDLLAAALSAVKDGSEPRIQLELALLKAAKPEVDLSLQALLFRIEQLERRLGSAASAAENREEAAGAHAQAAAGAATAAPGQPRAGSGSSAAARAAGGAPVAAGSGSPAHGSPATATAAIADRPVGAHAASMPSTPPRASAPGTSGAVAAASPSPASVPATTSAAEPVSGAEVTLERLRSLWPAVVDAVCKENGMVGAFLADARPSAIEGQRVTVAFPPGGGFSKKKVEANRQLVQKALAAFHVEPLLVDYVLSESAVDGGQAAVSGLSEAELLERLKQDFGAREVFGEEQPEAPKGLG